MNEVKTNVINKKAEYATPASIILTLILIIQVILIIYPVSFIISASFIKDSSLSAVGTVPFSKPFSLYQYKRLFTETQYIHWYLNTLYVATWNTFFTVVICSLTGYIFSRFMFPFKKTIMASMLVIQMFPSFVGMIALYVILWKFNYLNTLWGLIVVYAAGSIPFNSWIMKGYFDTVSKDIAEAAYIDGATPLGAFLKIIIPSAKPRIIFLALTSFTAPWMDFILPKMLLRGDDKKTLAVGLYELINGRSNNNFTMFAAGALLVAIPFAILFVISHKAMLQSLAGTGGKE